MASANFLNLQGRYQFYLTCQPVLIYKIICIVLALLDEPCLNQTSTCLSQFLSHVVKPLNLYNGEFYILHLYCNYSIKKDLLLLCPLWHGLKSCSRMRVWIFSFIHSHRILNYCITSSPPLSILSLTWVYSELLQLGRYSNRVSPEHKIEPYSYPITRGQITNCSLYCIVLYGSSCVFVSECVSYVLS
jgi:hypothetical protein